MSLTPSFYKTNTDTQNAIWVAKDIQRIIFLFGVSTLSEKRLEETGVRPPILRF